MKTKTIIIFIILWKIMEILGKVWKIDFKEKKYRNNERWIMKKNC